MTLTVFIQTWLALDGAKFGVQMVTLGVFGLLGLGVVLWALTWLWNRGARAKRTGFREVDDLKR